MGLKKARDGWRVHVARFDARRDTCPAQAKDQRPPLRQTAMTVTHKGPVA
jgi:hypothetical protein